MFIANVFRRVRDSLQRSAATLFCPGAMVTGVIVTGMTGCFFAPQHPVCHFKHPAIEVKERLEDLQDGICLETAHKTTIDDDFQLRANDATDHARHAAKCVKCEAILVTNEYAKLGRNLRCRACRALGR